jgi:hypothetical protein
MARSIAPAGGPMAYLRGETSKRRADWDAIGVKITAREATTRDDWRPATTQLDPAALPLTPQDAYVLSRIDGATTVGELAMLTGLPAESLRDTLQRLAAAGAIGGPPGSEAPPVPGDPTAGATHRQLFETQLHALPVEVREARAATAVEPELSAFCFDPTPRVVRALLANPRAGLAHARLVAAHHGNAVGLDALGEKAALVQDGEVQRLLLRNPQCAIPLVQRLLSRRRLAEVYQTSQSRELPERNRKAAMDALRRRFAETTAEERVELILRTEGRCLAALSGLSLDGRSAVLLCARTVSSTILVENLARWPATPPTVIAHLLRQPMVMRMPPLRTALKRHPNCPKSER